MRYFFILMVLFFSLSAKANEEKMKEWTYSNTIDDILACSAYYFISAMGLERAKNPESTEVMNHSDKLAFMAAYLGEDINLKQKVIDSKFKLHLDNQLKIIDNDYNNLSLLIVEYNETCQNWYNDNFKTRILFWTEDYIKRFGE